MTIEMVTGAYVSAVTVVILCALLTVWESKRAYLKGYEDGLKDAKKATLEILDRKFKRK